MNLKIWLRAWLGIAPFDASALEGRIGLLSSRLDEVQRELDSFRAALKARATLAVPRFTDYDSAQIAALHEFEEKPNGVQR